MESILKSNSFGNVVELVNEHNVSTLRIEHDACSASICLLGGQLLTWQPKEQKPVFWLSNNASYEIGKAIRGGVPLCWPWFGPHLTASDKVPNHGFVRQNVWQLANVSIEPENVIVSLKFSGENYHSVFPQKFELTETLILGRRLEQQLLIENLSDQSMEISGALHSYFQVSNPNNIAINGLTRMQYDDKLTGEQNQQQSEIPFQGPIDRIYHSNAQHRKLIINDHQWQRSIVVEQAGCQQWVLWNPGEQAANIADIHDHGETEYICLEAANTDLVHIPAKGKLTMAQKVSVSA